MAISITDLNRSYALQNMSADQWEAMRSMKEEMRRQMADAQAAAYRTYDPQPVQPPEPNKVLLLLGDDE